MLARLFVVALVFMMPIAAAAAPQAPASFPDGDRYVVGELALAQPNLTTIVLSGDLYVFRYDVNEKTYDADDLGAAYHGKNKYGGEAEGAEFVAEIEASAENSLRSTLLNSFVGATLSGVDADVDETTLLEPAGEATEPPVTIRVSATVHRTREQMGLGTFTDKQVAAAFASGAELETTFTMSALEGYVLTYSIGAPSAPALAFTSAKGGSLSADGQKVTVSVSDGAASAPATISLRGKGVPAFTAEDSEVSILVDISDVDASVGKAIGGDLGTLVVDITVFADLNVIKIPDDVKSSIPPKLKFDYLSSDAIRILLENDLLSQENLSKLEETLAKQVREKLGGALGGTIAVESGFDDATLAPGLVSTPISSEKPIVFTATAHVRKPLAGGPIEPAAAIALYTRELPLTLPKIQGLDTLYTIIAPPGLAFGAVTGSGGDIEKGTSADGRDQFTVRPTGESATISAAVAVTPTFVLLKFWPVVLLAVLLLVLIIGTPIALVMRRKKKGKTAAPVKK